MEAEKKSWQKPELIVLVRSKPEEAVLQACKLLYGKGAGSTDVGCMTYFCVGVCAEWGTS